MIETYSFGEWVSLRRKALDLSQRDLAEKANCALPTVKKIESDERHPSRELAHSLAEALQVPPEFHEIFIECARGLRPVDALAKVQIGKVKASVPAPRLVTGQYPAVLLPVAITPFIGREDELAQIAAQLDDLACRLLTLVGSGGIGKTRLAYEAAAQKSADFPSGVYAIPLAGVNTPDFLLPTIAERFKLNFYSGADPKAHLFDFLREKQLLLVLDNFEHLLDGAGLLTEILSAAPKVKILVTSRERLNLQTEWVFPVDGFVIPTTEDTHAKSFDAIQLFAQSARRVQPDYHVNGDLSAVIQICQLTEGMPLAIEIAASWVRRMPTEQIAAQIQQDIDFLAAGWRDVPERHRSIRALFEQSWRLLTASEQQVLMQLSVFRGGFDLEAAKKIAGASLMVLASLEDKSLVRGNPSGYYSLHELVRQYAELQLVSAKDVDATRSRHLDYYTYWTELADVQLHGAAQIEWTRRIETNYDNLRAALQWAFSGGNPELGVRLTNALWWFWFSRGHWREGYAWIKTGLEKTEGVTGARAWAYNNAMILVSQMDGERGREYGEKAFAYAQQLGLKELIAMCFSAINFSIADYQVVVGNYEMGINLLRETGNRWYLSSLLFLYGDRAREQGDLERAETLYSESLDIARTHQDYWSMSSPFGNLGRLAIYKGDFDKGRSLITEAIEVGRQIENPVVVANYLIYLGTLEIYLGDYADAERDLDETLTIWRELGHDMGVTHAQYSLADLALHRTQLAQAAALLAESISKTLEIKTWQVNFSVHELNVDRLLITGKLAIAGGDYNQAAQFLGAGDALRASIGYILEPLPRAEYDRAVETIRQHLDEAAFAESWAAGQGLDESSALEKALAYAGTQQKV